MSSYFRKIPYKQDMAPAGGYPRIEHLSKLPKRGVSGVAMMASALGFMGVGFFFVARGNQNRRELSKEQKIARLNLLPILQAESDRWVLNRLKENLEKEKLIMKDVPGWTPGTSVYNNAERWITPRDEELAEL